MIIKAFIFLYREIARTGHIPQVGTRHAGTQKMKAGTESHPTLSIKPLQQFMSANGNEEGLQPSFRVQILQNIFHVVRNLVIPFRQLLLRLAQRFLPFGGE